MPKRICNSCGENLGLTKKNWKQASRKRLDGSRLFVKPCRKCINKGEVVRRGAKKNDLRSTALEIEVERIEHEMKRLKDKGLNPVECSAVKADRVLKRSKK